MLTTEEFCLEDYVFKSSPESCSDHSYTTDYMDTSDEDFMTRLSSELDIPLLLNPGEDELGMLNSVFDQSPEEILSDIASPPYNRDEELSNEISELQNIDFSNCGPESYPNLQPDIKPDVPDSPPFRDSTNSVSLTSQLDISDIKDEVQIKTPPLSPESFLNRGPVNDSPNNILFTPIKVLSSPPRLPIKHVPIVPKTPYTLPVKKNNLIVLKKDLKPVVTSPSNVVLLENIKVTTVPHIPAINSMTKAVNNITQTVTVPSVVINPGNRYSVANPNVDPRILKRQQRKIKNRESASLSRKKKKDYVTSLEEQVKELTAENKKLQTENLQLKERLALCEDNSSSKNAHKSVKPSLFLCAFLLMVGLNFDLIRKPFSPNGLVVLKQDLPKVNDHHGRSLLWSADEVESIHNETTKFSPFSMCPAAINQTESARLVLELERWIGKPIDRSTTISSGGNASTLSKPTKLRYRKKKYGANSPLTSTTYKRYRYKNGQQFAETPQNELQVFSMRPKQIHSEFFEAINRQDDTFYVVSFTDQNMLLPAIHHNKTARPKMSLIMPSMVPNDTVPHSSLIPLMQIDCEVLDTRLIHIKHGSIPQHLKKYGNETRKEQPDEKVRESNTNETHYYEKPYKPYFINKYSLKNEEEIFEIN